jgi:outer membrane protein assembly factor BamB
MEALEACDKQVETRYLRAIRVRITLSAVFIWRLDASALTPTSCAIDRLPQSRNAGRAMSRFSVRILLLISLSLTLPSYAPHMRWPQFRGPNGSGVATEGKPPVHFGPNSNVVWKIALPPGASSPCLMGHRIFLTGVEGEKLQTLCINSDNGKVLWQKAAPAEKLESFHKQDGSPAASTPVTDGRSVFVYFGSYGVIAYDFEGNEKWKTPLPIAQTFGGFGTGTSPVLASGVIILNRDHVLDSHVLGIDASTGKVLWKTERGQSYSWSTPLVWKNAAVEEVVLAGSLQVTAYDPRDGSARWTVHGIGGATCSTPVAGGGLLFVSSWSPQDNSRPRPPFEAVLEKADTDKDGALNRKEMEGTEFRQYFTVFDLNNDKRITADEYNPLRALIMKANNALLAIRPGGRGDITDSHVLWKETKGLPYVSSPLFYQGRIYLIKDGGMASCFDAATGKTHYLQERLGAQGSYYASPVAVDGRIYAPSLDGVVVVFKAGDTLEVLAKNEMKERIFATPAIAEDTLYVRTAGHLHALAQPR